jgi:hypothetical protein
MSMSPIAAPSFAVARPHVGSWVAASWPMDLAQGCMSVNHDETTGTTGTTGSKRLDPGHLMGVLT